MKTFVSIMLICTMVFVMSGCYGAYDHCALIEGLADVQDIVGDFSNTGTGSVAICDMVENDQWQLYACTVDEKFGYYLYAVKDERGDFRHYGSGFRGGKPAEIVEISGDYDEPATLGLISDGTAKSVILHNDETGEKMNFKLDKEGIAAYFVDCDWTSFSVTFIDKNGNVIEY